MINLSTVKNFAKSVKEKQSVNEIPEVLIINVAGVTFDNRQSLLKLVSKNTKFILERDRTNPYDFYAVKVKALVLNDIWAHLGFVPKDSSKGIAELLDKGVSLSVSLEKLNGFQISDTEMEPKGLSISIKR